MKCLNAPRAAVLCVLLALSACNATPRLERLPTATAAGMCVIRAVAQCAAEARSGSENSAPSVNDGTPK